MVWSMPSPVTKYTGPSPLRVRRTDDRRIAASARPKEAEMRRIGIGAAGLRRPRHAGGGIVPVLLPQDRAGLDVEGIEVVGDAVDNADLTRAVRRVQAAR